MPEVYTYRMVATRHGEVIGRICGVRSDTGEYLGSYFERVITVPPERVGDCRNYGINAGYQILRERVERDEPRTLTSWRDRL